MRILLALLILTPLFADELTQVQKTTARAVATDLRKIVRDNKATYDKLHSNREDDADGRAQKALLAKHIPAITDIMTTVGEDASPRLRLLSRSPFLWTADGVRELARGLADLAAQ